MKTKHWVALGVATIAGMSGLAGACINAKWGGGSTVIVNNINGEKMEIGDEEAQNIVNEKESLEVKNNELNAKNNDLEEKIKEYESQIQVLEEEKDDLETAYENSKAMLEQIREKNEGLQEKIDELESDNNSMKVRLKDYGEETGNEIETGERYIEFSEVPDILYDGSSCKKYFENGDENFSVGGKTYYSGFELNTYLPSSRGFAYFNLQKEYSKMEFDVGRSNNIKGDAKLLVTSSDGLHEEYDLAGNIPFQHIKIDLNKSNDLTIKLVSDVNHVNFGFFNIYYIP